MKPILRMSLIFLLSGILAGCGDDMKDQPRYEPLEKSNFFEDGRSSRPLVEGTVARGHLNEDTHLYTGKVEGKYAEEFPFEIDEARLRRGQQRFQIFCAVCHGLTGEGNGIVVQRGFPKPASFHTDRLREIPPGYFFEIMTNGFGYMPDYAAQISPEDRWAIAAYMRVLQKSQHTKYAELTAEEQKALELADEP